MSFYACYPLGAYSFTRHNGQPGNLLEYWTGEESVDGGLEYKVKSLWKSYHAPMEVIGDSCIDDCEGIGFGWAIRGV